MAEIFTDLFICCFLCCPEDEFTNYDLIESTRTYNSRDPVDNSRDPVDNSRDPVDNSLFKNNFVTKQLPSTHKIKRI